MVRLLTSNDDQTLFEVVHFKLRRLATRYQDSGQVTEELVIRRAIEEIFYPNLPSELEGASREYSSAQTF